jgi:glycosyltransferase involved in cell wall biosynthesis
VEFSIVYPAYEEEADIRATISRSVIALRSLFREFEILIVDDRGRDRTGEIADALAAEHKEVRVLRNERNVGQGGSILRGFQAARGALVMHNAMDYPLNLDDLPKMLALMADGDIVVAVRRRRSGYTVYRKIISVTNVMLLRLLFDLKLRDYNFVQLYRKEVLKAVPLEASSTGFAMPALLMNAHDRGFRIREIVLDYHPRLHGVATAGHPRVILRSLTELMAFWVARRRARHNAVRLRTSSPR